MFSRFSQIAIAVILGLCVALWVQYQMMSSLKAENKTQAKTILNQQQVNVQLISKIHQEREATQKQTALEQAERGEANEDIKQIERVLSAQDCAAVALPADVIKRLRPAAAN